MLPPLHSKAPQKVVLGLLPARPHKRLLGRAPSSQPTVPHPALLTSLEAPSPGLPITRAPEQKAHDCKFWPHEPVAPEDISGQFPRPPSPSSQIQPLLKFDLSEPVANFCPIHPHTPSSEQPLSPLPPLNPVLNVGSISCSNLFIRSAINKLCALHGSKQTSLLSWRVTLATESQETNNMCGVLTGGIKRGGRECWEAVCVCVCVCVRACVRTCSVTQLSHSVLSDTFAAPWIVACQDPLSMGFSGQEYWTGLPFQLPGDLPNPAILYH